MSLESKFFGHRYPFSPNRVPFFYGYVVFIASLASRIISIPGHTVGIAPFTEPLLEQLQISRTHFSDILLWSIVFSTLSFPLFGRVFDAIGTRRAATYAGFFLGLSLLFLGHCIPLIHLGTLVLSIHTVTTLILFLGFFLLKLLGQNLTPLASRLMLLHWYDKNSCTAQGVSGFFVSIFFGTAPVIINALIRDFGFQSAWNILGYTTLFIFVPLVWLLCRDDPQPLGMYRDNLPPDLTVKGANEKITEEVTEGKVVTVNIRDKSLSQALATFDFWIFTLAAVNASFSTTSLTIHIVDICKEACACIENPMKIFLYASIVSSLFGIILGKIQDKISIRYLLVATFLTNALIMIFIEQIAQPVGLWTFVFLFGCNWAIYGLLFAVPWLKLFGHAHLAQIISVVSTIALITSGLAPTCMSRSHDMGSYFYLTRICSYISFTGLVISIGYIMLRKRQASKQ